MYLGCLSLRAGTKSRLLALRIIISPTACISEGNYVFLSAAQGLSARAHHCVPSFVLSTRFPAAGISARYWRAARSHRSRRDRIRSATIVIFCEGVLIISSSALAYTGVDYTARGTSDLLVGNENLRRGICY